MGEFWTATVSNALGGLLSGVVLLLVAGGFGLLVSRRIARRGNRPSVREANVFIASSIGLSAAAVGTLVIGENSPPALWVVGGLVVAAFIVLDVLIYTLLAADWVARWRLHDDEERRRLDQRLNHVAAARGGLDARRQGHVRRRRRVAGRKRRGG